MIKYVWIILLVAMLVGGSWLKITSMSSKLESQEALIGSLKQELQVAHQVNQASIASIASLKQDQDAALESLRKLSTDLTSAKTGLAAARRKLTDTTVPSQALPPTLADTIINIQAARDEQQKADNK